MKKLKVKLRQIVLLVILQKIKLNREEVSHSLCCTAVILPTKTPFSAKTRSCVLGSISWKEYFTQGPRKQNWDSNLILFSRAVLSPPYKTASV